MADELPSTFVESLAPLYRLEQQEGWRLFKRHFDLTTGFAFVVVVAPDDWGIALLRSRMSEVLPSQTGWQRVVFDPAGPAERLTEQLLNLQVPASTSLIWVDAEPFGPDPTQETGHKKDWAEGDRVLAPWEAVWLYPATISSVDDRTALVSYDDADSGRVPKSQLRPIQAIAVGALAYCRTRTRREYLPGTIMMVKGDQLAFRYHEGGSELTTLSMIRLPVDAVATNIVNSWEQRGAAWRFALARLNRYRNSLQARIPCTLALAGPTGLIEVLRESAPDFWSIRSSVFRIEPPDLTKHATVSPEEMDNLTQRDETPDQGDPDVTLAEAARLRGKSGQEALLVQLLRRAASQASARQKWQQAIDCLEDARQIDQSSGADPLVTFNLAVDLSEGYMTTAQYDRAIQIAKQALEFAGRAFGPMSPHVAVALNNLGAMYRGTNQHAEAESLLRRALEIDARVHGPDHPRVAVRLNNLAALVRDTNKFDEAEPLLRRALAIDRKHLQPEHPNIARDLNNLAQVLKATNRFSEAESLMHEALAIDEKNLGPDHPRVATRLNNLGQLLRATNRVSEAESLMRRALAIDEKSFGPEHPKVAIRLNNLAELLRNTGRLTEAEALSRRMVGIFLEFIRRTGNDHPNFRDGLANYIGILEALGRSKEEVQEALDSLQKDHGVTFKLS